MKTKLTNWLKSLKKIRIDNPWKWAFLGLIAIILGLGIWGFTKITVPVNTITDTTASKNQKDVSFEVAAEKAEINRLVAHSLNEFIEDDGIKYELVLNDEAELIGTFKLFGHDVQFYLYLLPYVMENGNVQLKATNLSVGELNLPITSVMNLLAKQLKIPEWVQIDSKKQLIVLNLNEYKTDTGMTIKAKKFDLKNDDIRFTISVPLKEIKK